MSRRDRRAREGQTMNADMTAAIENYTVVWNELRQEFDFDLRPLAVSLQRTRDRAVVRHRQDGSKSCFETRDWHAQN